MAYIVTALGSSDFDLRVGSVYTPNYPMTLPLRRPKIDFWGVVVGFVASGLGCSGGGHSAKIPYGIPLSVRTVSTRALQRCPGNMRATCVPHACNMRATCVQHACNMPHACHMRATCVQHACHMRATCVPHACHMRATCVQHATCVPRDCYGTCPHTRAR